MPILAVFLLGIGDCLVAHELLLCIKIDSGATVSFREKLWIVRLQYGNVLGNDVRRLRFQIGSGKFLYGLDSQEC